MHATVLATLAAHAPMIIFPLCQRFSGNLGIASKFSANVPQVWQFSHVFGVQTQTLCSTRICSLHWVRQHHIANWKIIVKKKTRFHFEYERVFKLRRHDHWRGQSTCLRRGKRILQPVTIVTKDFSPHFAYLVLNATLHRSSILLFVNLSSLCVAFSFCGAKSRFPWLIRVVRRTSARGRPWRGIEEERGRAKTRGGLGGNRRSIHVAKVQNGDLFSQELL